MRLPRWIILLTLGALVVPLLAQTPPAAAVLPAELPVYEVVKAGLTPEEARSLANAFDVPLAADRVGGFRFASDEMANVPMKPGDASRLPKDEGSMETTPTAFDLPAIRKLQAILGPQAMEMARGGFSQANVDVPNLSSLAVGKTMLKFQAKDGSPSFQKAIDTGVGFNLSLSQRPLVGPGAKVHVTFAPSGEVTELTFADRELKPGAVVPLIPTDAANRACALHYPPDSKLMTPRLVYFAPPLASQVQTIFPHYECRGTGPSGETLVPAMVPAVQGITPKADIVASADGVHVDARADVSGGTAPYTYSWQSMTTFLPAGASSGPEISYDVRPRDPVASEVLMVTVTDANGLVGTAQEVIPLSAAAARTSISAGPSPQSVTTLDVGGEFNVWEWQCVKDSAAGFSSTFGSQGVPVAFKWTGTNAWERDFRQTGSPTNGDDSNYVDNVDLAWYTGHGGPNAFTFDNTTHDDGSIVPSDARWGNRDLEWMQLESCNVLQFDDGSGNLIWNRWAKTFDGLHLLNGFQTTASCISTAGGTAGRFSKWLFPQDFIFITIPALNVRQAWAQMARELEPAGKQYVTMGSAGPGWVTNYNDYFWGQGPVGPDIPKSQIIGYWWLVGTV